LDDLEDIPAAVRRSVEDSLRRLRVEAVTVVQLHNRVAAARAARANLGVGAQLTPQDVLGPVLDTFQALRHEGKTRALGCCAWGGEYDSICQVLASGAFDTVLVGYSILSPTAGRAAPRGFSGRDFGNILERAAAQGTSGVVLRVLEAGALAGVSAPHPNSGLARSPSAEFEDNVRRARSLQFLVRPGQSLVQAAIRYALGDPRVAVVLVGFSSLEQIEEAAMAAGPAGGLLQEELARIEDLYSSDFGLRERTRRSTHAQ
jgi:aryl-alcohol dehydrogenase-like predicted oxidoreductase